jgi:uncharacterized protein (TIGR02246 family)
MAAARWRTLRPMAPEEAQARLVAAFEARDLDAFVDVYEDDAVLLIPPDGRTARGKAEIRSAMEPMFALPSSFSIDVTGKLEGGGLALIETRWALGEQQGRTTVVVREQPDGRWLIALDNPMSGR